MHKRAKGKTVERKKEIWKVPVKCEKHVKNENRYGKKMCKIVFQ
jgi:hypothetical protein